jgi:hypothetical protein
VLSDSNVNGQGIECVNIAEIPRSLCTMSGSRESDFDLIYNRWKGSPGSSSVARPRKGCFECFLNGVLRWPDNNSMFRRLACNKATSKK